MNRPWSKDQMIERSRCRSERILLREIRQIEGIVGLGGRLALSSAVVIDQLD